MTLAELKEIVEDIFIVLEMHKLPNACIYDSRHNITEQSDVVFRRKTT